MTQAGTITSAPDGSGGGVAEREEFDEHAAQLAGALRGLSDHEERQRRFLHAFVRPRGLDQPATPVFADAVEDLARTGRTAARAGAGLQRAYARPVIAGAALDRLVQFTQYGRGKRLIMTKDEFVAAAVNETPRTPVIEKLRERTRKRLKSSEAGARARQRTINMRDRVLARR